MHRDMRRRTKNVPAKFAPPPTPFQQEAKIPEMEPLPWVVSDALRSYASTQEEYYPEMRKFLVDELLKDQEGLTRKNFITEFKAWLRGVSRYNYDRRVTPWGTDNLLRLPGVTEMFDAELEQYYKFKTALLKLATWGPSDVNDAFLYYKYIVLPLWIGATNPDHTCKWFDHDGRQLFLDHCSYTPQLIPDSDTGLTVPNPALDTGNDTYAYNALPAAVVQTEATGAAPYVAQPFNPKRYVDGYQNAINKFYNEYVDDQYTEKSAFVDDVDEELRKVRESITKVLADTGGYFQARDLTERRVLRGESFLDTQAKALRAIRHRIDRANNSKFFMKYKNTLRMGDVLRDILVPPHTIPYNGPYIDDSMVPRGSGGQGVPTFSGTLVETRPSWEPDMVADAIVPLSGAVGPDATARQRVPAVFSDILSSVPRPTSSHTPVTWARDHTVTDNITSAVATLREYIYNQFEVSVAMIERLDEYTRWMDAPEAQEDERVKTARREYLEARNKIIGDIHTATWGAKQRLEEQTPDLVNAALTADLVTVARQYFEDKGITVTGGQAGVAAALQRYAAQHAEDTHTDDRYHITVPELAKVLYAAEGETVEFDEVIADTAGDGHMQATQLTIHHSDVDAINMARGLAINYATGAEIERAFLPWANKYSDMLLRPVPPGSRLHTTDDPALSDYSVYTERVDRLFQQMLQHSDDDEVTATMPAYRTYRDEIVPLYKELITRGMYIADRVLLDDKQYEAATEAYKAISTMISYENVAMMELARQVRDAQADATGDTWDDGATARRLVAAGKGSVNMVGTISTIVNGTVASAVLALGQAIHELEAMRADPGPLTDEYDQLVELLVERDDSTDFNVINWDPAHGDDRYTDDTGRSFERIARRAYAEVEKLKLDNAQTYMTQARDWQLRQLRLMLQIQSGQTDVATSTVMKNQREWYEAFMASIPPGESPLRFVVAGSATDRRVSPAQAPPVPARILGTAPPPPPREPVPAFGLPVPGHALPAEIDEDDVNDFVAVALLPPAPPPPPPRQPKPVQPRPSAVVAPTPVPAKPTRDDIMGQIRRRDVPLRHVTPPPEKGPTIPRADNSTMVGVFLSAMASRRSAVADDNDDDSDDTWDDEPAPATPAPTPTPAAVPATTTTATPVPAAAAAAPPRRGAKADVPPRREEDYRQLQRETLQSLLDTTSLTQREVERYEAADVWAQQTAASVLVDASGTEQEWEQLYADHYPGSENTAEFIDAGKYASIVLRLQALQDPTRIRRLSGMLQGAERSSATNAYGAITPAIGPMALQAPYISKAVTGVRPETPFVGDSYTPIAAYALASAAGIRLPPDRVNMALVDNVRGKNNWAMIDQILRYNLSAEETERNTSPTVHAQREIRDAYFATTEQGLAETIANRVPPTVLIHVLNHLKNGGTYGDHDTTLPAIVSRILQRYTDPGRRFAPVENATQHRALAVPSTEAGYRTSQFDVRVGNLFSAPAVDVGTRRDSRLGTRLATAVRTLAAQETVLGNDLPEMLTKDQRTMYQDIIQASPPGSNMNSVYSLMLSAVDTTIVASARGKIREQLVSIYRALEENREFRAAVYDIDDRIQDMIAI